MRLPLRSFALALLVATAAATAPVSAQTIDVLIRSPRGQDPVFGEVTIEAETLSAEAVQEVIFLLDGEEVGRLTQPPWRLTVDVGQDNVEHRFEVVAHGLAGGLGSGIRVTPKVLIDEAVDLELQQLYVTVTRTGERVLNLDEPLFRVLDNGQPQSLVTFEQGDVPFTAALLVDASSSMRGDRLRTAVEGAKTFVQGMNPLDEAMMVLFSDRLLYASPFTNRAEPLEEALGRVSARGGTALNDHLYLALKRLEERQGRRVVVLLSDGIDMESTLSMRDVLWIARQSQALIYWIRLREADDAGISRYSSWRNAEGHAQEIELLDRAVLESGGRIQTIQRLEEAHEAFREILRELREQYVLGYYPSSNRNDGAWHEVQVRVQGAGLAVRARGGYIDY